MNNTVSRIIMGLAGFVLAFGSALASLPDGNTMTVDMIGKVPLLVWVLSLGAGLVSAIDGKVLNRKHIQ